MGHNRNDRHSAIILDTNVLIEAMGVWLDPAQATRSRSAALLVLEQSFLRHRLCFTRPTMQEFCEVALDLKGKTRMPPSAAMRRVDFIKFIEARMQLVEPRPSSLRCRDPKDQMILEAAQGANAVHIISADADILTLSHERHCRFLHPQAYADILAERLAQEPEAARRKGKSLTADGQKREGFKQRGHLQVLKTR